MKLSILAILLLLISATVTRAEESTCTQSSLAKKFVVSGLLRKGSEGMTVKIAHSIEVTSSAGEAAHIFASKVERMHPGYSVLTTLVSMETCEVPMVPVMGLQQLRL